MHIRHAVTEDIKTITGIFESARTFMRKNGNHVQWAGSYPGEENVIDDIKLGTGYVVEEDGQILGYFCFFVGEEPTYDVIYDGEWLRDEEYGVIHRIASGQNRKGVGTFAVNWCFNQHPDIRIDTHRSNIPMINMLTAAGFEKCGIIYCADGEDRERIAFQKVK